MNKTHFRNIIILLTSTTCSYGATLVYGPQDAAFFNTTTQNTGGGISFAVTGTSGLGTASYSIDYLFTADLSSCGGPSSASFAFTTTFTSIDGNIVNSGGVGIDGVSDTSNAVDPGETISVNITQVSSPYFTMEGMSTNQMYNLGAGADDRTGELTGSGTPITLTDQNINFFPNPPLLSYSIENTATNGTAWGPGFITYRITAVPEPSTGVMMGLSSLALLSRRKR